MNRVNEELVNQIRGGSERAFSILYNAYHNYLNVTACCYLFDSEIAQEVVNDVFVHLWTRRENLPYPIHSYIVRSVKNGCLNYIRDEQRREEAINRYTKKQLLILQEEYIQSTPPPLQDVEMHQIETEIHTVVVQLPPKCQLVFRTYFYAGKDVETIAADMNMAVSTVRTHLKRAYAFLRQSLKHLLLFLCLFLFS